MVVEFPPRYKRLQGAAVVSNQMASCSIAIGHLDFCLWSCMRHPVRDEGCALRPLGLSRASIGRDTAARYRSARVTVTAGSRGSRVDGETGEAVQPAGTGPPAADAGPPAAEPERASAAEPSWVARAVWRGIWQLIAAVLLTVAGLWSCGSQRAGPLPDPGAAAGVRAGASRDVAAPEAGMAPRQRDRSAAWRDPGAVRAAGCAVGAGADEWGERSDQAAAVVDRQAQRVHPAALQHHGGVGFQLAGVDAGGRERHQVPAAARGCCAGGGGQLAGAVFGLLTVGLFTFYLTANGPQVRRALRSRMPPERQQRVLWAWWNLSSPASRSRSHPNGSH